MLIRRVASSVALGLFVSAASFGFSGELVAAVIPFALTRYPNGSWANYEWVDPKGLVPNPYYERVRNLRLGFKN